MAIGAIQAMKAAGVTMEKVVVGGVDATQDALAAMKAGDLDVTVFQNAAGQGKGAVDTALKLAKGEKVDSKVWIPFELVTPANMDKYSGQELSRPAVARRRRVDARRRPPRHMLRPHARRSDHDARSAQSPRR